MSKFLRFDTEAEASVAEQTIMLLAARSLHFEGWDRDALNRAMGRNAKTGETNPNSVTLNWDIPKQAADGKWVVLLPDREDYWDKVIDDAPAGLAVGAGRNPESINWNPILDEVNSKGGKIKKAKFKAADKINLPGREWISIGLSVKSLPYDVVTDPEFTSPDPPQPR